MIQIIRDTTPEMRIQPYPFPIVAPTTPPSTEENTQKASLRRMRIETV
jgi:hypothetical protein